MSSLAPPLDLSKVLAGRRLVVLGGTGFLGKVWWSFLLSRYPEVGRLYLVMRPKGWRSANERFWEEIANSQALSALREQFGSRFEEFLREKISVVEGDVVKPLCGLDSDVRAELRGTVDIVVNAAGVVD
ncbi:MAG TPA: SDR family oxidoreductase, partial [Polyangiaceae bacterium]